MDHDEFLGCRVIVNVSQGHTPNSMNLAPADPHQPAQYPRSRYQPSGTNKPGTHFPAITGENRRPGQSQPHNGPYPCELKDGAGYRTRTDDLLFTRQLLYQLS